MTEPNKGHRKMNLVDDSVETRSGMYLNMLADESGEAEAAMVLNSLVDERDDLNQEAEKLIRKVGKFNH